MKFASVLILALVVVVSEQQSMQQVLKEWRKLVAPHMSRCMCQSKAREDLVEEFFQFGTVTNDPCFKCSVSCWAQAVGAFTSTGNLNATGFRAVYGITDEIVHKCGSNPQTDICQKGHDLLTCTLNVMAANAQRNTIAPVTTPVPIPQNKYWNMFPQYFEGK